MKPKFILVNHSILDFEEYKEKFFSLSALLKSDIAEVAEKYDLRLVKVGKRSYFSRRAVFYSKEMDLEVVIAVRKRHPPEFV